MFWYQIFKMGVMFELKTFKQKHSAEHYSNVRILDLHFLMWITGDSSVSIVRDASDEQMPGTPITPFRLEEAESYSMRLRSRGLLFKSRLEVAVNSL